MKSWLISLVVSLFFITCKTPQDASSLRFKASKQSTKDCYFNIYSGLNTVVLGISKLEDVEKLYGKGIVEREKYHYSIDMGAGWRVLRYRYPELGIDFESNSSYNYKSQKAEIINVIRLYDRCTCRTPSGVKVQGNISDIRELLPLTKLLYSHIGHERANVVTYIPIAGGELYIEFKGRSKGGIEEFFYDEIHIYYSNLT